MLEEYSHFFEVKLDLFDGPIDLLLHLVKSRELPIEQVSLAAVAEQYLSCIEMMRQYDLEVAGEYLVIAATLLSIKSSILLNEPVEMTVDEDGNLVDPHQELLRRLKEAEVYKEGADKLIDRPLYGLDVFSAPTALRHVEPPPIEYADHDPMLLAKAFRKLLEKAGEKKELLITLDSVSIMERMMAVIDILKKESGPVVFYKLIPDLTSKSSIIGTFVALLELCKRQVIEVRQEETFSDIGIYLVAADVDASTLTSEFDAVDEEIAVNE